MVFQAEHCRGVFELHVLRHQIEALALALRRRQQGENLSAVVVNHDQHERGRRLTQQRQRVEVVERGEIPTMASVDFALARCTPAAVEISPSMPLAPRLLYTG